MLSPRASRDAFGCFVVSVALVAAVKLVLVETSQPLAVELAATLCHTQHVNNDIHDTELP